MFKDETGSIIHDRIKMLKENNFKEITEEIDLFNYAVFNQILHTGNEEEINEAIELFLQFHSSKTITVGLEFENLLLLLKSMISGTNENTCTIGINLLTSIVSNESFDPAYLINMNFGEIFHDYFNQTNEDLVIPFLQLIVSISKNKFSWKRMKIYFSIEQFIHFLNLFSNPTVIKLVAAIILNDVQSYNENDDYWHETIINAISMILNSGYVPIPILRALSLITSHSLSIEEREVIMNFVPILETLLMSNAVKKSMYIYQTYTNLVLFQNAHMNITSVQKALDLSSSIDANLQKSAFSFINAIGEKMLSEHSILDYLDQFNIDYYLKYLINSSGMKTKYLVLEMIWKVFQVATEERICSYITYDVLSSLAIMLELSPLNSHIYYLIDIFLKMIIIQENMKMNDVKAFLSEQNYINLILSFQNVDLSINALIVELMQYIEYETIG